MLLTPIEVSSVEEGAALICLLIEEEIWVSPQPVERDGVIIVNASVSETGAAIYLKQLKEEW